MARGKSKEKDEGGEAPKGGPTHEAKTIGKGKLLDLLKAKRQAREYTAETNGAVGSKIAEAVNNYNLNKKAFGWLSQLDRMELERAKALYDDFMHYVEISGLGEKMAKVQKLPLNEEQEDEGDEDGETEGNVAKFPGAGGATVQ